MHFPYQPASGIQEAQVPIQRPDGSGKPVKHHPQVPIPFDALSHRSSQAAMKSRIIECLCDTTSQFLSH
jgi:hypothetical protein